ncbi:MAG: NADAR domain-containing protein [Sulfurimicrobium sp.]|jgi:type I restriction enzyme S subunit|nr:NADAR domain-containing protein [Sulfurimicrobium sp.]
MQSSVSENRTTSQVRSYERAQSIVFLKTKEAFGGLSNMAGGFPLRVNGIRIFNSEALYQACRFPHLPDVQGLVLSEPSPMTAKMKTKPYRKDSRSDWDQVRVRIMRWCLRIKLVQNWKAFGELLLATGDKPIVEESYKDDFWGAKPVDKRTLIGMNVLGRLLMELREEFKSDRRDALLRVEPLQIPDFLLMRQPIPAIEALAQENKRLAPSAGTSAMSGQPSLFDRPSPFDGGAVAVPMHEVNESMPQIYANSNAAITDLKPYPEYEESGLPWLGRMPGHWELTPNRGLIRRRKVLVGDRHQSYQLLSLTKSGVIVRDIASGKGKFSADMGTSQEVRDGDLVFCLFDVPETPRTVGLSRHNGMITGAYTVFECANPKSAEYFEIFYRAMDDRKLLSPLYSGLRNTIRPERFLGTKTPQPPSHEQAAIVRFLDHSTHRLDRAIRAKRKTIALLNEQKQAIIHRAVTHGLDPAMPLKDSGINWLGDIPAHWEVLRCRYLFREVDSRSTSGEETHLSMSQKLGLVPSSLVERRTLISASYAGGKLCEVDDLVLNRLKAHLGVFARARDSGVISPDYTVLRKIRPMAVEYFEHLLRSPACRGELRIRAKGLVEGFWRLYTDDFYDIRLPVPPHEEQARIVNGLHSATNEITITMERVEREIELLREYRTRLIADVVTGQLDVREAAAKLPEKPATDSAENAAYVSDEAEPTDEEATV